MRVFLLATLLTAVSAVAEDLTIDGVTYEDVSWGTVTPTTVTVFHRSGVATIPLEKLPAELREKFNYDPKKAEEYRALRQPNDKGSARQGMEETGAGSLLLVGGRYLTEAQANAALDQLRQQEEEIESRIAKLERARGGVWDTYKRMLRATPPNAREAGEYSKYGISGGELLDMWHRENEKSLHDAATEAKAQETQLSLQLDGERSSLQKVQEAIAAFEQALGKFSYGARGGDLDAIKKQYQDILSGLALHAGPNIRAQMQERLAAAKDYISRLELLQKRLQRAGQEVDASKIDKELAGARDVVSALVGTMRNPSKAREWLDLGDAYGSQEQYVDGIKAYQECLRLDPRDDSAWHNMANCYAGLEDYEHAIFSYKESLKVSPNIYWTWTNLARSYEKQGRHEDAISACQKSLEIRTNEDALWLLALIYQGQKKYDVAVEACKKAIEINSQHHGVWRSLGSIYAEQGNNVDAVMAFERAVKINPTFALAWYDLGVTCTKLGWHDKALDAVRALEKLDAEVATKLKEKLSGR